MTARGVASLLSAIFIAAAALGCSKDIRIGAVISDTGAVATYGKRVRGGLDLALEEINAAGGYQGRRVELLYRDDATMPDAGEQVVRDLIDKERVHMIIGAVASPVTLRIAPICEREGVVLLSPSSSSPQISSAGDYIFRNYPSDILEGTAMARFAKDEGLERVAIFALDNDYGRGLTDVFAKEYENKYRHIVQRFFIAPDRASGFADMVEETRKLDPDGVYLILYDEALRALVAEIHAADLRAVRMGTSAVPQTIGRQVGAAAENLVYPQPGFDLASTDPAVVAFVQAFRKRFGEDPDIYAAHGYDALKLFLKALENAGGSTHPDNVKVGMSAIKSYQGAAGATTFDRNGDVVRYPRLFIVHQGHALPYDQFTERGLTLVQRNPPG